MGPFDLYLVLTPIFALFIILALLAFKLSLRDQPKITPHTIQKIRINQLKQNNDNLVKQSIWQTNSYLRTFSFLMRNHSFLEMCLTQRAKNKLPILLSITTIGLLSYFLPNAYYLCIGGILLVFIFVLTQSFFEPDNNDLMDSQNQVFQSIQSKVKDDQNLQKSKKYIYLVFTLLICATSLVVCGSVYQNYINSSLQTFAITFVINVIGDLFLIRPIGFLLISLPLIFNLRIQHFVQNQNMREILYTIPVSELQIDLAIRISPRKKQANSPTKVPRAKLQKNDSENQSFLNAMDSLKKIKRQKSNHINLMTPAAKNKDNSNQYEIEEYSLNHLFNDKSLTANNHLQQTPVANFNIEQESNNSQIKTKKKGSELIIVEFKNNKAEEQQDQQDGETLRQNIPNFIHSNLDDEDISETGPQKNQAQETSNSKFMRFAERKSNNQFSDDDSSFCRNEKNDNFLTVQQNKAGLMCINEQGDQEPQIEEIDLNSPNKRRLQINSIMQEGETEMPKKRRKVKHSNSNAKRRVLKFTSGQPYLQYLPNMLSKETNKNAKRSQPIHFKNQLQIYEDRVKPRKSLNKIKKQSNIILSRNNENQCPEAMFIEDL